MIQDAHKSPVYALMRLRIRREISWRCLFWDFQEPAVYGLTLNGTTAYCIPHKTHICVHSATTNVNIHMPMQVQRLRPLFWAHFDPARNPKIPVGDVEKLRPLIAALLQKQKYVVVHSADGF